MKAQAIQCGAALLVLAVLLAACASPPREAEEAALRSFAPDQRPRIHSARRADPLLEDEQAGAFMGVWLEALIRVGALSKIEARFIARDNRRVPILFSRTAIKDSGGEITDIICIAKDMTGYVREGDD